MTLDCELLLHLPSYFDVEPASRLASAAGKSILMATYGLDAYSASDDVCPFTTTECCTYSWILLISMSHFPKKPLRNLLGQAYLELGW
jgi:hypothetical protein